MSSLLLGLVVVTATGCGARGTPPAPPSSDTGPAADTRDAEVDPQADDPAAAGPANPDPPATTDDDASEPTSDRDPQPDTGAAPDVGPSGEPVPEPIAALFHLPAQVRVDETGSTRTSDTVEVVQLTGEFVGGGLAEAVSAFDAALDAAGLSPNRDVSAEGAAYVAPIDERTLAIGLVADRGTVSVSVDLLIDRGA